MLLLTLFLNFSAAIGIVYFAGIICTGSISGASLNPAVAISLVIVLKMNELHYALWVILANFVGAIIATIFYYLADTDEVRVSITAMRNRMLHPSMKPAATTGETEALISA